MSVSIRKAGVKVGARGDLNFIEGSNVTLTISDTTADEDTATQGRDYGRIDVTISATGSSGAPSNADYLVGTANADLTSEIAVGTTPGGELGGTWAAPTVDATHSGSAHHTAFVQADHDALANPHHAQAHSGADHTDPAAPVVQAFGDAAAAGTGTLPPSNEDHRHGMPANPVTAHEAAGDPHTGYRLESADHSHASTGLQAGTVDHGALTGLSDDDHSQYALDTDLTTHAGAADPHTGYRLETADHSHATTGAQAGQLDHGTALTGLTDDDHTQYRLESVQIVTADIADNAVTLAKLLDIATASFLGRTTSATGDPEVLTSAQATALLDLFSSTLKGLVPASGGGTSNFLRADGTWTTPTASVAAPFTGNQATGTFTISTEQFGLQGKRLKLTTTQRGTITGTGRLSIYN